MDILAFARDMTEHQQRVLDLPPCLDNPNVADVDRKNSLPEPPEPEDDATGAA